MLTPGMAGDLQTPACVLHHQPSCCLLSSLATLRVKYAEQTPTQVPFSFTPDLAGPFNLESKSLARWDLCVLPWKAGWPYSSHPPGRWERVFHFTFFVHQRKSSYIFTLKWVVLPPRFCHEVLLFVSYWNKLHLTKPPVHLRSGLELVKS